MTSPDNEANAARRLDLDWLRIGAFGLLIFYHIGMFYVSWGWHVKSSRASDAIEPIMMMMNPWRLHILFFISGVATRYMADKTRTGALATQRFHRLFWPLLFGVLVLVPPQAYYQVLEAATKYGIDQQSGFSGDVLDFYAKYITGYGGFCREGDCLVVPTWNHVWFVGYLLVYTLVLCAALPLLRRVNWSFAKPYATGWAFLVLPVLFLWITRATLFPIFGDTHALIGDWYLHVMYGGLFVFGFAIGKWDAPFDTAMRFRWLALILAIVGYAIVMGFDIAWNDQPPPDWQLLLCRGARALQSWMAIVALLGFARRFIHADSPARRYFTEAIFPFYLVHQTVIVIAAYHLDKLSWPLALEVTLLTAITVASCFATFEVVKRIPLLRPFFGLRMRRA